MSRTFDLEGIFKGWSSDGYGMKCPDSVIVPPEEYDPSDIFILECAAEYDCACLVIKRDSPVFQNTRFYVLASQDLAPKLGYRIGIFQMAKANGSQLRSVLLLRSAFMSNEWGEQLEKTWVQFSDLKNIYGMTHVTVSPVSFDLMDPKCYFAVSQFLQQAVIQMYAVQRRDF